MSLFDFLTGGPSDKDVGTQVLQAYFNEAVNFPEFTYGTYDAWLVYLNSQGIPDFDVFVGNLVNSNKASISPSDAAQAVADLANMTSGMASNTQIVATAGGRGNTVNLSQAIPDVAIQSATDLVKATQNVGQGILSTAKLMQYLPWILGIGGVIYLVAMGKSMGGSVGKSVKTLADAGAERLRK